MGISFEVDRDKKLLVSTFSGVVSDADLVPAYRALAEQGDWQPGFDEIVDLREADFTGVTTSGLRALETFWERMVQGVPTRTAILAPADLPFGLARVYQALAEESPEVVQVFRELEEALEWLGRSSSPLGDDSSR